MVKKIKIPTIIAAFLAFFFFYAHTTHAFISTTPLIEELKAKEYQAGSSVFNTTTKTVESLNVLIFGTGDEEVDKHLGPSALQTTTNLIAILYSTPPASNAYYLADLGQRLNLIQPAYAQGIGYNGLRPLLPLWKASRNIAYFVITFISLLVGLGIMLRIKINPQAAITIQAAIPKVVIALILITFSYAIAGLIIDLIYLLIGVMLGLIPASFKTFLPHSNDIAYYYGGGLNQIFSHAFKSGLSSMGNVVVSGWQATLGALGLGGVIGAIVGGIIGGVAAAPIAGGAVLGFLGAGVLLALIVGIILLLTVFKIFWMLLVSYINVIISILVAPFQLMLSAIPGQNTFSAWINNLLKNLLVFPATVGMFILAFIFANLSKVNDSSQGLWAPPLLGVWGEKTGQAIGGLIALGLVFMIPKVADIIKSMFERKPFPYGAAIGEAMGPAKKMGGAVYGTGASTVITHLQRRGHQTAVGILSTLTGARGEGRPLAEGGEDSGPSAT